MNGLESGARSLAAAQRAELYRFFSTVFSRPPMRALAQSVFDGTLAVALHRAFGSGADQPLLTEEESCADAVHVTLEAEYMALLAVPGPRYVPPYESVYIDSLEGTGCGGEGALEPRPAYRRGLLWGPSTADVSRLYGEAGLALSPQHPDVPDHLGLELEFMARLCDREAEAWASGDWEEAARWRGRQGRFLNGHLRRWAPDFCERLSAMAAHPFYPTVACLMAHFVLDEDDHLLCAT